MVFQSKSPKITLICLNVLKSLNNFLFASYYFLQLAIIKVKVDALLLSTNEIRIHTNMPWQNSFSIASFLGPFGKNIPIQIGKITCQIARFPRNFFFANKTTKCCIRFYFVSVWQLVSFITSCPWHETISLEDSKYWVVIRKWIIQKEDLCPRHWTGFTKINLSRTLHKFVTNRADDNN